MPYLIDGSNLGGVLGGLAGSRNALGVVQFVLPWARNRGRVLLVFDGEPQAGVADRYGSLEIRWSSKRSADAVIRSQVESEKAAWVVFTDDVELGRSCRDLGAAVEKASALSSRVGLDAPRKMAGTLDGDGGLEKPHPTGSDVAYWREVFGVEPGGGRRRKGR